MSPRRLKRFLPSSEVAVHQTEQERRSLLRENIIVALGERTIDPYRDLLPADVIDVMESIEKERREIVASRAKLENLLDTTNNT